MLAHRSIYYLAAIVAALSLAHRAPLHAPPPLPKIPPRVAILKPLRGVSEPLRENIISFLEIALSAGRVHFRRRRATRIAPSIFRFRSSPATSSANITVTVGDEPGCANRKIAKLIRMAERASQDRHLRAQRRRHLGRARSSEARGRRTDGGRKDRPRHLHLSRRGRIDSFASRMEALFVNTDFAPQVMSRPALEPMHYALRRDHRGEARGAGCDRRLPRAQGSARRRFPSWPDGRRSRLQNRAFQLDRHGVVRGSRLRRFLESSTAMGPHLSHVRPLSLATIFIHGPFWALMLLAATGFNRYAMLALALVIGARIAMAAVSWLACCGSRSCSATSGSCR